MWQVYYFKTISKCTKKRRYFSFNEFYDYHNLDKRECFDLYIKKGGFPYASLINDEHSLIDYIQGILNTVLIKDIMSRKRISDSLLLESVAKFLFLNVGSLVTVKKISDTLNSNNRKTTSPTVENYLTSIVEAMITYRVDRYNIAGKKHLQINSKYYIADLALKNAYLGKVRPNIGHDLENIVFIELIRRGHTIYVGDTEQGEVDFVAIKNGIAEYYQVSYSVIDQSTYNREVTSLKVIKDNYRKILLTLDNDYFNDEGIEHYNIIDLLLK